MTARATHKADAMQQTPCSRRHGLLHHIYFGTRHDGRHDRRHDRRHDLRHDGDASPPSNHIQRNTRGDGSGAGCARRRGGRGGRTGTGGSAGPVPRAGTAGRYRGPVPRADGSRDASWRQRSSGLIATAVWTVAVSGRIAIDCLATSIAGIRKLPIDRHPKAIASKGIR